MRAYQQFPVGTGFATVLPDMDFETYSEAGYYWDGPDNRWRGATKTSPGIAAVGASVYSEHPSTEVLSLAYDLKDGYGDRLWTPDSAFPPFDLFNHILTGGLLEAWNSSFEFYIWRNVCHRRMGWPELPFYQLRCAMSKARAFSLPGKLENAATALRAQEQKDSKGTALIRKLCIPRSPTKKQLTICGSDHTVTPQSVNRLTPEYAPSDFADLYSYNRQDIKAEASVSLLCPDLLPRELDLWLIDQAINIRGVHIDQQALADCIFIVNHASTHYTAELQALTGGTVQSAGEIEKIRGWLGANGIHTSNLDADAVEAALKRKDLSPSCRRVLEIRDALGGASVKKLFAIERMLAMDGRLHDLFAFCGADRTGRWAGRGPQPQNLPSSGPKVCRCKKCEHVSWKGLVFCPNCGTLRTMNDTCDWGNEAMETGFRDLATRDLAFIESRWGDACALVSGCLRGLFAAAPGKDLICSDFSAIEAVVIADLAGEEWRQEVFRTHGKIYEMSASKITGVPFEEFARYKKEQGQHHPLRKKVGKVAELASGFGGGLGAWKNFGAHDFMTDDEITTNVKAWRKASPAVVKFWYGLQEAAYFAVQSPGTCYSYQAPATKFGQPPAITYGVKNDVLYCCLPSGRMLSYHQPRLEQGVGYGGRVEMQLTYMGWNSNYLAGPIGWVRLDTWGGKLTENVVQATARDLMAHTHPLLERAGYPIVLHVHDEIVSEVPEGTGSIEEFEKLMSSTPTWAAGWPVKAAGGWRGKRYRKE